jgi:hypothetical protein
VSHLPMNPRKRRRLNVPHRHATTKAVIARL